MSNPKVSILINCFNGQRFLTECLASVLSQDYDSWEVVFVDNASTDRSIEIFRSIMKPVDKKRLKIIALERNVGQYPARNIGLGACVGEYICFLDVDDFWLPSKLAKMVRLMDERRSATLGCSSFQVLTYGEDRIGVSTRSMRWRQYQFPKIIYNYPIGILTAIVRRSALADQNLWFDKRTELIGDYKLFTSLAAIGQVAYEPAILSVYRHHNENESTSKAHLEMSEYRFFLKDALAKFPSGRLKFYLRLLEQRLKVKEAINEGKWLRGIVRVRSWSDLKLIISGFVKGHR